MSYFTQLANPFANTEAPKKLLDGACDLSAGFRLRRTGQIVLHTNEPSYIVLLPGFSNNICWCVDGETVATPDPYGSHFGDSTSRLMIKHIRLVGAGLRLHLNNNQLENEGYWEAARIPFLRHEHTADATTCVITRPSINTPIDLSSYQSYQTGALKDLHTVQFGLNSQDNEHDFVVTHASGAAILDKTTDPTWDAIIIKLHGRNDGTSPSIIFYDVVSLQEVVYQEDTAIARLMTESTRMNRFEGVLEATKFNKPAINRGD